MSFLLCKKFCFSKCAINIIMFRGLKRILKPKAVIWSNVAQGKVENISSSSRIIALYPRPHHYKYPHIFAVFGAVYSNTSGNNENSNDKENVCLVDDTNGVTTPIPNRHKKVIQTDALVKKPAKIKWLNQ